MKLERFRQPPVAFTVIDSQLLMIVMINNEWLPITDEGNRRLPKRLKISFIAVMHILSFPVMPIMQSDPVGCSAICLQMVVIGDWLSLCCFRATGDRIIMPHHCCVPGCTSNSRDKTLEAISFHTFPKDRALAREWIAKIRRDVGDHFQVNEHMKVCSLHFEADAYCSGSWRRPDDKKLTTVTRQKLKGDAIPTKFFWSTPALLEHSC